MVYVGSSMFQALGHTLPPLTTSFQRVIVIVAVPIPPVACRQAFELPWIWHLSVIAITVQLVLNLLLLRRTCRRLTFAPAPAA